MLESIIVLAYTKPIDSQRQKKENFLLSADSAGKVMIARARAAVSENKTGNNLVVYQLTSKEIRLYKDSAITNITSYCHHIANIQQQSGLQTNRCIIDV